VLTRHSYVPIFILVAALVPLSLAALWWWTGPIRKLDRRGG
jgi:ACS family hexuronate transporter-like MFS transporter